MDQITSPMLRKIVSETEWKSPTVRQSAIQRLTTLLETAVKDELLTRNPAVEEAGRVTGHLYQALTSSIRMYAAYFKFAFYTGMRPGEVAALRAKQSRRQHKQSPYVFPPTRNVEYIQQANMTDKHFQAALVELKIRSRRQYNCRHTYATMCLMAGMNLGFIANQLGHSVQMLLST